MVKTGLLLAVALVLQHTLMADLRIGQVQPDLLLLVAGLAGLAGGSERGAVAGFAAGLLADVFLQTPLGLAALTYSLVGFAAGTFQSAVIRPPWWIGPATALAATFAGVVVFALLGAMIGRSHFVRLDILFVALGVGAMNAVLAVPVERALQWAVAAAPERSYLR